MDSSDRCVAERVVMRQEGLLGSWMFSRKKAASDVGPDSNWASGRNSSTKFMRDSRGEMGNHGVFSDSEEDMGRCQTRAVPMG